MVFERFAAEQLIQFYFLFIGDFPRAGLSMQELPELP